MIILGIDPGLATIGYGVIRAEGVRQSVIDYGVITTPAKQPLPSRLKMIYEAVLQLYDRFNPDAVALEELFFNTNITTGIRVAEARGIVLLCGEQKGLRISEYTPLQVKQAVVGYGRAEKKQVMTMVTSLLGLKETPKPDDTADALAIAVCHAHSGASRLAKYFNN